MSNGEVGGEGDGSGKKQVASAAAVNRRRPQHPAVVSEQWMDGKNNVIRKYSLMIRQICD